MNYCKLIFTCLSSTLLTSIFSCTDNSSVKTKKLKIDDSTYVVGDISQDTVYNGNIKFYNSNGTLLYESEFRNGILNGVRKDYHLNGLVSSECNYSNGLLNGRCRFFDEEGKMIAIRNLYYGLNVGESINLLHGKIQEYSFYSLDFEPLFQLEYDPRRRKEITSLQESYFFIRKDTFSNLETKAISKKRTSMFLYLPNPPEYDFNYTLVYANNDNKVISRIRNLRSSKPWIEFVLEDYPASEGKKLAIELNLKDSIYGGKISMLKVINEIN